MELRPDAASDHSKPRVNSKAERAWVTPDDLNVAPALLGAPLANPWRRLMAILVDLTAIALLSKSANAWLLAAMALTAWQLTRKSSASNPRRKIWQSRLLWAVVAVLLIAGVRHAWNTRSDLHVDEDDVVINIGSEANAARAAPAQAASSSPEALQAKLTELESALEKANQPKPLSFKKAVATWSDDLGLGLGWTVLYFSALPVWWKGQTLGKRLFKMRVVELTGKPITLMLAFKRYGGYAAGVSTGMFGFLQVLWDSNRQALHDKAAHTVVLDLRGEPLPKTPTPSLLPTPSPSDSMPGVKT